MVIVARPSAHADIAVLFIKRDGGGVSRPHLQGEKGQLLFPAKRLQRLQQRIGEPAAAKRGPHGHIADISLVQNRLDPDRADQELSFPGGEEEGSSIGEEGNNLLFFQGLCKAFPFNLRQLPGIRLRRNHFDFIVHNLARRQCASAQVRAALASTSSGTEKDTGMPATGGGVIRSISSFRSFRTRSASCSGHSTISSS